MKQDEGRKQNKNRKLTHTPLPILWGLKALITEAAERARCVVTKPMTVTHSVVYTFINICKRDIEHEAGNKHRLTNTRYGMDKQGHCYSIITWEDHVYTKRTLKTPYMLIKCFDENGLVAKTAGSMRKHWLFPRKYFHTEMTAAIRHGQYFLNVFKCLFSKAALFSYKRKCCHLL